MADNVYPKAAILNIIPFFSVKLGRNDYFCPPKINQVATSPFSIPCSLFNIQLVP